MKSRLLATCSVGAALVTVSLANVVYIPTGRYIPAPDQVVATGFVSTTQGRLSWSWKAACTNNLFTGFPRFRPYSRLYLHRATPSGAVLVGTYTYHSMRYDYPEQFSGTYFGQPGQYRFTVVVHADQDKRTMFPDQISFTWDRANVTGW